MELQREQTTLKEICDVCGKPKAAAKASSDVTRYLSFESRCACGSTDVGAPRGSAETRPENVVSIADVQKNLGDDFQVESLLGQGGMGAVFKVKDKRIDKTLAVKVLNPNLVEDAHSIKRFEQEAKAASNLTHANLAAVYDYGMGKAGAPYLVMDYLDGTNLADLIKKETYLDAPRALDLFIQIAEAIAHAHAKGVIHRDIKPNNVIVCKNADGLEYAKVVDFGIAKVLPSDDKRTDFTQTSTGEIVGSPLYMSPEQCVGNKLDARTDIYALGCVMYEALTGIAPFADDNAIKIILRHVNDTPLPINRLKENFEIPKDLDRIIMHCLERDPNSRYQSMMELEHDLRSVRDKRPIALRETKPAKSEQKKTKNLAIICGITGLTVVIASVLAIVLTSTAPQSSGPPNMYQQADKLDIEAFNYYNQGRYQQALDLLQFNLHTFKEDGNHVQGNPANENMWLGDINFHIAECYVKMKKPQESLPYFKEALRLYAKGTATPYSAQCAREYADVQKQLTN